MVTKIDEATAGSWLHRFSMTGTRKPKTADTKRFPIMARTTMRHRYRLWYMNQTTTAVTIPQEAPSRTPTTISFRRWGRASRQLRSFWERGSDKYGHGLGSRVSSHAADYGHYSRQGNYLLNGVLENVYDKGRQKCGYQVDEKPGEPHSERLPPGGIQLFLYVYAGQLEHVFVVFFYDYVDDIVYGNNAQNLVGSADYGNYVQVVPCNDAGRFFLVSFRVYGKNLVVHQGSDQGSFWSHKKGLQTYCAD